MDAPPFAGNGKRSVAPRGPSPTAQLEVDGVTFSYAQQPALHGVSLAVQRGDFAGIVGPNGSGKSTLLRIMDGLLRPDEGVARLCGQDIRRYPRRQLAQRVALVPQHFNLEFDFSVLEVVAMGHYCRGESNASDKARAALRTLRVEHLAARDFRQLSGGERQMVVLAQALTQQPDVLLLDEPASALDVTHQLAFSDCLRRLNAEGLTVMCVLHDLNLALQYCRSLLMLSRGRVVAWGPADEVLEPRTIGAVYGVSAHVHRHAGRTFLTFSPRPRSEHRGRVHLVCGAGTGACLMRELTDLGFAVSAGVVNALDTDEVTGREVGVAMAVEAAFCAISDEAYRQNMRLACAADLVVLTDVPIGPGNLRNLEVVRETIRRGVPVWMIAGLAERDYSGAAADVGLDGARQFSDAATVMEELRRWTSLFAPRALRGRT